MRRQPWFWAMLFRWIYRYSDAQVVQTWEIAGRVAHETRARSIVVVPNAVQLPVVGQGSIVAPDTVVPKAAHIVLVIGSKPRTKGFDDALSAFRAMSRQVPGWHLVFLGLSRRSDWARSMKYDPQGERLHVVEPVANIQDWYDRAEIFVLSSRTEGMPNALLEAMASGCACVAYNCPTGPGDLIEDKVNGLLVPPGNREQLADALTSVAQDAELRKRFGEAAKAIVRSHAPAVVMTAWEGVLFPAGGPGLRSNGESAADITLTGSDET
jgi:glycosyltransferase involved in cell wall biosynthesis